MDISPEFSTSNNKTIRRKSRKNRLLSYKKPRRSVEKRKAVTKRQMLLKKKRAILSLNKIYVVTSK